jgi:hypothetical protein
LDLGAIGAGLDLDQGVVDHRALELVGADAELVEVEPIAALPPAQIGVGLPTAERPEDGAIVALVAHQNCSSL